MEIVNNNSTSVLQISFFDETGAAVIPSTVSYQIRSKVASRTILDWTQLSNLTAVMDLVITAVQNQILTTNYSEDRIVTIQFTYSGGRQGVGDKIYQLVKLAGA